MKQITRQPAIAGDPTLAGAPATPAAIVGPLEVSAAEQKHGIWSVALTCNVLGAHLQLLAEQLEPNLPGVTGSLQQAIESFDSAGIPAEVLDIRHELMHGFSGAWSAANRARENG